MSAIHPEPILRELMECERRRLPEQAYQEALEFIDHNEFGLVCDTFVFFIQDKQLVLSDAGERLLRDAAKALGI